jgi:hypothetical protein
MNEGLMNVLSNILTGGSHFLEEALGNVGDTSSLGWSLQLQHLHGTSPGGRLGRWVFRAFFLVRRHRRESK